MNPSQPNRAAAAGAHTFHARHFHPRLAALTALVCGCALLAGCATPPPRGDLSTPIAPESLAAARSLPASSLPSSSLAPSQAAWPTESWWQQFGDPQLDTLVAEGLAGAADLRVAEARFARVRALAGAARSSLLPSVNAIAEGGAMQPSGRFLIPSDFVPRGWPDYGQASLALHWELDFWGKNRNALAAARGEAAASGVEAAAARLSVAAAIAAAYADFAGLHAARDAADNAVRVRRETAKLLTARMERGLEDTGAVERARSALAAAEGELASVDESLALSRNGIAALVGAGPDRGLDLTRPAVTSTGSSALPAEIPANLLGRRPDVVAARLRAEAAASRIGSARAAFYPNVNLAGIIGLQALGLDNVFRTGSDFGSVGPAVTLPIFDGGRLKGHYRAAEAEYAIAVGQYDGTLVQALREVADVAASQRALSQRLDRARAAQSAAEAAWTIAGNRYRGGLASNLAVLTAEDALIAARRTVAALEARAFALDVAMIRALGGGYRS